MKDSTMRTLYAVSRLALDAAATVMAFITAYYLRQWIPIPTQAEAAPFWRYIPITLVQTLTVIGVFFVNRAYHTSKSVLRLDEFTQTFSAISIATMASITISMLIFKETSFGADFPRGMILYGYVIGIFTVTLGREIHRRVWHTLRMRGIGRSRVVVVGSDEPARSIIQKIQWTPYLGYELVGVVNGDADSREVAGAPLIGTIDDLPDIIDEHEIREVIIALAEGTTRREIIRIVNLCQRGSIEIKIFPDIFEFITTGVTISDIGGIPMLNVRDIQLRGWRLSLKRGMDIFVSGLGLIAISPVLMLFAAIIRIESPGPIFYCQERMGLDGKPFQMIKFRSMRQDAEANGPGWTVKNDPRVTRIGKWMRAKNVDEFPQLINVFLGEMSLVGPRPERPVYVEKFRQSIPRYMDRHREKAGMTGWAQVNGLRGDTSIPERTKFDLWYIENWSIWLDVKIILRTLRQMFVSEGEEHNAY